MEKRSTRSTRKKFTNNDAFRCKKCQEIEKLQVERAILDSKGNEDDQEELDDLDRKLKQLRGHICKSDYVNFDNFSDEDLMEDYEYDSRPMVQTRSVAKGTTRRQGARRVTQNRQFVQSEVRFI